MPIGGVATLVHHRGPTTLPGLPPDVSSGATIVCLHDAGGNGADFAALLDALADRHSPLAYDQPGHGRSAELDSLGSIPAMAQHLAGLLAGWGLTDPVLVGEGMGTAVALEAVQSGVVGPRALVLVGGADADATVADEVVDQLQRVTQGKDRRAFDPSGYGPDTPREVVQRAFAEWVRTDPRATLGDRRAQQAWSGADRLAAVTCPVLVVVGEHEDAATRDPATALAAALPQGKLVELAGAGRHGVIERPAALAGIIDQFLTEVSG